MEAKCQHQVYHVNIFIGQTDECRTEEDLG